VTNDYKEEIIDVDKREAIEKWLQVICQHAVADEIAELVFAIHLKNDEILRGCTITDIKETKIMHMMISGMLFDNQLTPSTDGKIKMKIRTPK
jgi:hypothetical protein